MNGSDRKESSSQALLSHHQVMVINSWFVMPYIRKSHRKSNYSIIRVTLNTEFDTLSLLCLYAQSTRFGSSMFGVSF